MKEAISTKHAPEAIGTYSQAVRFGDMLYVSGQIPLHPETMILSDDSMDAQVKQVFDNLAAVCEAADGSLNQVLKLTVYLIDLSDIAWVNQAMEQYFKAPYPARVALEVSALPRGARVEIDAMMACA
jgi:reactive intermediate/imine deaminase